MSTPSSWFAVHAYLYGKFVSPVTVPGCSQKPGWKNCVKTRRHCLFMLLLTRLFHYSAALFFFFCIADVLYWSDFWVWYHSVRCFGSIVLHNTSWCIVRVFNRHVTEALSWSFGCAANSGEIWFVIKWVFRCVAFSLRGMCLDWEWQKAPPHVPCVCGWTSCFNVVNQVSLVIVIDECAVVVCHEIKWIWANCCTRIESLPCIGSWPCAYLAIGAICLM